MPEYPECPFCEHRLTDAIPPSIEGSIKIKCPACGGQYEFLPQVGSLPLDDDLGIEVSKGLFGPHVVEGNADDIGDISLTHSLLVGGLCCCTVVFIIPVIMALLLSLFG